MNQPNIPGVIRSLVGLTVDQLMASRPLNLLLQRLVDRTGALVHGPVDIFKRCQAVIKRSPDGDFLGIHLQMHGGDVVSTSTFLGELVTGQHWDVVTSTPFTTEQGVTVTVIRDKQSGWITIHFDELTRLYERVCELRKA